jgi:hypothetical protein
MFLSYSICSQTTNVMNGLLQEVTVETEVRAAHNVLEACAQTETMERVVFTSSVTAVVWNAAHKQQLIDEKCWSDLAFCTKFKVPPAVCGQVQVMLLQAGPDRGIVS